MTDDKPWWENSGAQFDQQVEKMLTPDYDFRIQLKFQQQPRGILWTLEQGGTIAPKADAQPCD